MTFAFHRGSAVFVLGLAGASCGSEAKQPRAPEAVAARPEACSGLAGSWREVEPIEGTTIDEPEDGKVRAIPRGSRLTFEPNRLTVVSVKDRSESSLVFERASTGTCLLHARDSQGRPLDVEATLVSERLLRMHNIAEPRSPATLYERE